MLRLEQLALAQKAGVSKPTIARLERFDGLAEGHVSTLQSIKAALEDDGMEFLPDNGLRLNPTEQMARR